MQSVDLLSVIVVETENGQINFVCSYHIMQVINFTGVVHSWPTQTAKSDFSSLILTRSLHSQKHTIYKCVHVCVFVHGRACVCASATQ